MVLNRNPDNFFAETEQIAFCVANVVPGIDVTNDPLMQARLFSYMDTQLTRLGGPNFARLPINRPVAPVHNHQQDGFAQHDVPTSKAMYHPNSVGGGCPFLAGGGRGYVHHPEQIAGGKTRARPDSFKDHFSQATMFLASQSDAEREHLIAAFQFELGKVERVAIRERVVRMFANVDPEFAAAIAYGLGLAATLAPDGTRPRPAGRRVKPSPALSLRNQPRDSIVSRKVAILAADGVAGAEVQVMQVALARAGATGDL